MSDVVLGALIAGLAAMLPQVASLVREHKREQRIEAREALREQREAHEARRQEMQRSLEDEKAYLVDCIRAISAYEAASAGANEYQYNDPKRNELALHRYAEMAAKLGEGVLRLRDNPRVPQWTKMCNNAFGPQLTTDGIGQLDIAAWESRDFVFNFALHGEPTGSTSGTSRETALEAP